MHFVILILFLVLLVFAPSWWVKRVMQRYSKPHSRLPGTGGELARHLLDRLEMQHVGVEVTERGDHYDPQEKMVRLGKDNHDGKSLTAIAVAAHEVGHAIQDHHHYAPLKWRTRMVQTAQTAERLGALAMMAIPFLTLLSRAPSAGLLLGLIGIISLGSAVMVHLVTLPVEWDASFGRALPLLKGGGYINAGEERAIRKILKAAALTYVASALMSLLNVGRWWAILRRR